MRASRGQARSYNSMRCQAEAGSTNRRRPRHHRHHLTSRRQMNHHRLKNCSTVVMRPMPWRCLAQQPGPRSSPAVC